MHSETSLNGWVLFDKPLGISSANALNKLKRLLGRKVKIGHAGTLDPFASGLLIVGLGEATKLMEYAVNAEKEYYFTITWGEDRDTLDIEGQIIKTSDVIPNFAQIKDVAEAFIGEINQVPPSYSAISINGKRAYSLARAGEIVNIPPRKVRLFSLQLIKADGLTASFVIRCSKGFYVRSLARDIAYKLGACGYVSELRRLSIGKFNITHAISLDNIEEMMHNASRPGRFDFIKPIRVVLDDILVQQVTEEEAMKLKQGQKIPFQSIVGLSTIVAMHNDILIALGEISEGYLKPKRVFNL